LTKGTHRPRRYGLWAGPRFWIIYCSILLFSVPKSPRTRLGRPISLTPCVNALNTVSALLFVAHTR
jgi:hypothetical protein